MKKRIWVLFLLIGTLGIWLFYPRSFYGLSENCDTITVHFIENTLEHGMETMVYTQESETFAQLQTMFQRYSYHPTFRTLGNSLPMEGNDAGYWIQMYLDTAGERTVFICGGTGEIRIEGRIYRIGYWGNKTTLAMMNDIAEICQWDCSLSK